MKPSHEHMHLQILCVYIYIHTHRVCIYIYITDTLFYTFCIPGKEKIIAMLITWLHLLLFPSSLREAGLCMLFTLIFTLFFTIYLSHIQIFTRMLRLFYCRRQFIPVSTFSSLPIWPKGFLNNKAKQKNPLHFSNRKIQVFILGFQLG